MSANIKGHQNTVDQDGFSDTGVSNKKNLRSMVQKILDDESVSDCVNRWNIDRVEFQGLWLEGGRKLLIPRSPVFLLWVNEVIEHGIGMREHGLDISKDIVDIFSGGLLDGGANGPNQAENEPFLNEEELFDQILIFGSFEIQKFGAKGIK